MRADVSSFKPHPLPSPFKQLFLFFKTSISFWDVVHSTLCTGTSSRLWSDGMPRRIRKCSRKRVKLAVWRPKVKSPSCQLMNDFNFLLQDRINYVTSTQVHVSYFRGRALLCRRSDVIWLKFWKNHCGYWVHNRLVRSEGEKQGDLLGGHCN